MRHVRYSLRALRKTPAFTAGAILTVALTVGATTAIFSVVYGVLLRQLPYRDVEEVFWIWSDQPGRDRTPFNVPDFIDYRDSTRSLSGFAGFFAFSANLSDEAAAERVQGMRATGNLFDVLGARARMGRLLQAGDERPGADHVVVLAEPFWVRRFGGDPAMVGRAIRLNSEEYTVVGVAAAGFAMPILDVDFVLPFAPDQDARRGARNSVNFMIGAGRLAAGVSLPQAASELNAIAQRLQQRFPVENARKRGVRLVAAIDGIAGPFRTALLTLFAAVGAVLLIACANLANLMLSRATSRRHDLAVQLALGSSRANVVRQVLVEAMLVSVAGGLLGVLLALWGVVGLVALAPTALPRSAEIRVDVVVMLFSLAVSSLTGVLFGVIPALTSARVDVREALQGGSRGTTAGGARVRGLLVSSEVALAVVLLIVMTMLAKSFANVQAVAPGFDPAQVLSARLTLPAKRFNNREAIVTFQRALAQQLSSMPGVTHTGAITLLPLSGLLSRVPFTVEGRAIERERVPLAQFRTVSAGYFEAARIPLKRGRTFSERDTERSPAVAVVNEQLARQWLDGLEPIGARLLVDDNDGPPRPVEIVGVVGNVQQVALDGEPTWDLYLTYPQVHADNVGAAAANMFWIVRTTGDPMNLAGGLAKEVRRLDPEVVASRMRTMDHYLSDAVAPRRFSLSLMAAFGLAALALAITGIYAVVTYSVSQRMGEIAIRVALGATWSNIARLVIGHGLRFVVVGLCVGIAMAFSVTRLLSNLFFGIAAVDVATFGEVTAVVGAASILAGAIPAVRLRRRWQSVRIGAAAMLFVACAASLAGAQELPRGAVIDDVKCAGDPEQSYALYLPSAYSANRSWNLLLAFHPAARGRAMVEKYQAAAEQYGYIVAGSNTSRNGSWTVSAASVKAMSLDLGQRLAIDAERLYVTGMSGGARVALQLALNNKNIAGVIASSAGYPDSKPRASVPFPIFATAGTDDFNYIEMRLLDRKLTSPHYLAVFSGGHTLPPDAVALEAIEWMEVQAMKAGRRARDEALLERLFDKRQKAISATTNPAAAVHLLEAIAEDFKGLRDVSAEAARAKALSRQPDVKKALARERDAEDAEIRLLGDIFDLEAGLRDDVRHASTLARLRDQISKFAREADAAVESPERSLARRVLRSIVAGAAERVDDPVYLKFLQTVGRRERQP